MAEKTYVVKLAGDSKKYQQSMSDATRALDRFQKQNLSTTAAITTITTALSKFVGVAALVKGAQETVTRVIHGSQTSADAFAAAMNAAKVSVDAFFSSVSTGDFSNFALGLSNIATNAMEAYYALDRLGNAQRSWGYFLTSGQADITELAAIVRNPENSAEQRAAATAQMEQIQQRLSTYAQGYEERAIEAMAKKMTEATNLSWTEVSREDLNRVLELDLLPSQLSEEKKAALKARYEEYRKTLALYEKIYNEEDRVWGTGVVGVSPTGGLQYGQVDVTPPEVQEAYMRDIRELTAEYADAVLYNEALVRNSDEWLQELIQIVQQADMAQRSMRRINSIVQESKNATGNIKPTTTTTTTAAGPTPNYMSPIEYERTMLNESLNLVQKYSEDYVAIKQQLADVEYRMKVQTYQETIENEEDLTAALELAAQVRDQKLYDIAMESYAKRLEAQKDFVEQTNKVEEASADMVDSFKQWEYGIRSVDSIGRALEGLGSTFSNLEGSGWRVAGGIISTTGAVVQAYTQMAQAASIAATAEAASETPTVWGKIAAITTMLGAFASMTSAIQSSVRTYAEGGIIPGQNYRDGITARVSSGEMVINEADQRRLYDSIHSSAGIGGGGGPAVITGEQIVLAINNYARRTNRGELVFSGRG